MRQLKMISPLLPYSAVVAVPAEPQEHLGKLFGGQEDT